MTLYETTYETAYVYQCTCSKENSKKENNVAMKERVWDHALPCMVWYDDRWFNLAMSVSPAIERIIRAAKMFGRIFSPLAVSEDLI